MTYTIRPATASDSADLKRVCAACDLFSAEELPYVEADIDGWAKGGTSRHWFLDDGERPVGAAMVAPEEMSDNVWNMLLLGVDRAARRRGLGRDLVRAVEMAAQAKGARLLLIDTASVDDQAPARALYESAGYRQEAVIHDYYGDAVHRVTFAKRLAAG